MAFFPGVIPIEEQFQVQSIVKDPIGETGVTQIVASFRENRGPYFEWGLSTPVPSQDWIDGFSRLHFYSLLSTEFTSDKYLWITGYDVTMTCEPLILTRLRPSNQWGEINKFNRSFNITAGITILATRFAQGAPSLVDPILMGGFVGGDTNIGLPPDDGQGNKPRGLPEGVIILSEGVKRGPYSNQDYDLPYISSTAVADGGQRLQALDASLIGGQGTSTGGSNALQADVFGHNIGGNIGSHICCGSYYRFDNGEGGNTETDDTFRASMPVIRYQESLNQPVFLNEDGGIRIFWGPYATSRFWKRARPGLPATPNPFNRGKPATDLQLTITLLSSPDYVSAAPMLGRMR